MEPSPACYFYLKMLKSNYTRTVEICGDLFSVCVHKNVNGGS